MKNLHKKKSVKLLSIILIIYIVLYLIMPSISFGAARNPGIDKFPPSYQTYLNQLQQLHPNWTFTALETGLDWNTVIYNETTAKHGRNLVQGKTSEWVCPSCGYKAYDGSNWVCASESAVRYMMDPRNFINELYIFQFEALSYVSGVHTEQGVEKILQGSFMHNAKADYKDAIGNVIYSSKTYAQIIMEAGVAQNVSPYHLASRIRQEIGSTPGSAVSGTAGGELSGIYNFYNIGAYDGANAVTNGLIWAKTGTTYNRPWTSPEKSIHGGAAFISSGYINAGQDTLYLQKFDVDDTNGLYSHQYMTNCLAPYNETRSIFSTYLNNALLNNNFNFIIPVYKNMPTEKSPNPSAINAAGFTDDCTVVYGANLSTDSSTVNIRSGPGTNYDVISYAYNKTPMVRIGAGDGWSKVMISSGGVGYISNQYLTTNKPVEQGVAPENPEPPMQIPVEKVCVKVSEGYVNIRTSPGTSSAIMAQAYNGDEVFRIEKGTTLINGYYWDKIMLKDSRVGYVVTNYLEKIISDSIRVEDNRIIAEPDVSINTLIEKYPGKSVVVTKADGGSLADGEIIGTGCKVNIDGVISTFIKLGDISGDGLVKSADYIAVKNYIMSNREFNENEKRAADIDGNGDIKSADYISIKNHIMATKLISLK